ncbi:PAS domain-containing sensor histidine kinase [Pseudoxanthomonas gei]|uniref:PAS domain-containing sensor histidine kinase n=1 Tax=Pseudoxanthomonas gei TaxID=1383030 RepID=UPI001B875245|nr:PAS domain-containing sensor histidine kinase [Pseudoxanthomonas gei]
MPDDPQLPQPGALYEGAACGLLLTELDGSIVQANQTFCQWLGYPASELAGKRFPGLLSVGARMFHQTHWLPLMRLQGSVSEVKMDFRHRDGHKVPMVVNARMHEAASGRSYHALAAFMATDRDRYERELIRARAEAEELLQQRTALQEEARDRGLFAEQMIGIVSHDLRNPLTAIRVGAEMLGLDETDPKRLRLANRINQSVDRALNLIADLLDFTLTRSGRPLAISRRRTRLHEVIAGGIDELRLSFPSLAIVHKRRGSGMVDGDRQRLLQVLGNLVANAERYGDRTRTVTVTSSIADGMASLTVHNHGPSINAAVLPTLFMAMTRGSHAHDAGGGVGLGLYIVSEIAKEHGGKAIVASDPQAGTSIGIEFPVRAPVSTTPSRNSAQNDRS